MFDYYRKAYSAGYRFGLLWRKDTLGERKHLARMLSPFYWIIGPVAGFCWRQGMRDGMGLSSLFSILRVLGA